MSRRPFLRKQDLAPDRKVILVDRLGRFARPLIRQARSSAALVIFMKAIHGAPRTAWFQASVSEDRLREFSLFPFDSTYDYWHAEDIALANVEEVYSALKRRGRSPASVLVRLYGDPEVESALKKNLVRRLAEFYQTIAALRLLATAGGPVEFYPSAPWREVAGWLNGAGGGWTLPEGVMVGRGMRADMIRLESALDWIKWAAILVALPWWVILGVRRITWPSVSPKPARVAFRLYDDDWGFNGEATREIDWLLDGRQLRREDALFVIERPVSAQYRAQLVRRGHRFEDVSGRESFRSVSFRWFLNVLLLRGLPGWILLWLAAWRTPSVFLEVGVRGWLEFLRWSSFLERWRPRHLVVYNHFHFEHLFRNVLLRAAGCASWYYVHSIHDRSVFYAAPDRAIRAQVGWAYLGYDYEVHWGARDAQFYRGLYGNSRHYLTVGPLWSAHVRRSPQLADLLAERKAAGKVDTVVAVFDASLGPTAPQGEAIAKEFYDALIEMLDQPAWALRLLLFKAKFDPKDIRAQAAPEVVASLERLMAHPRCVSLDANTAPGGAIAEADLTVSIAFTSTTVEALGARRRALYFDPGGKYMESYYDQFPGLVAHGRESLAHLCEHWLSMAEADFQKYLDQYLAPEFGGHLDGGAVARFRSALSRMESEEGGAATTHG